jgi:hypothetical protein
MKKTGENSWSPKKKKKKTSVGHSKNTKFKNLGSNGSVKKGYRKRYRGQGKV